MRRATRPLNTEAVKNADNDFYAKHPELIKDGQRIPLSPTDPTQARLRQEWMDLYVKHGGAVEQTPKPPQNKPDDPVQPCPNDTADTLPTKTPKNCLDSPKTITLPPALDKQFDERWTNSFPGGKSQEEGGTLVRDKDGNLKLINTNPSGRNSASFPVDRNIPTGYTMVGVFHTHPYDASEGGDTGVSLSGGDAAYMINKGDPLIIAQSGDEQFMYLRTEETPASVDFTKLNDEQNQRVTDLMTNDGKSFSEASQIAAKETAQKYGLAYYEGKDGVFTRVSC